MVEDSLFSWHITLGNVLEMGGFIVGAVIAYAKLQGDVRIIKHDQKNTDIKITGISEALNNLSSILVKVAVQDERINSLEKRIDDLQHGRGIVLPDEPRKRN